MASVPGRAFAKAARSRAESTGRWAHNQNGGVEDNPAYRFEILDDVVVGLPDQMRCHGHRSDRGQKKRVSVWRRARGVRSADRAIGAGTVLDDKSLAQ